MAAKPEGLWVVPFIRPYRVRADIGSWFGDPAIFDLVQEEFKRGYYRGIGEFHISGRAAASEWVKKTVDFAVANDLFLHAHADAEAVEILMGHNPKARIVWAHTGFGLEAERVSAILTKYPTVWGELSYRSGIVDGGGKLTAEWRALFTKFPDRFLLGSDTWINERWATYGDIMAGYRAWLAQLPKDVAAKIANGNAKRLFGSAAVVPAKRGPSNRRRMIELTGCVYWMPAFAGMTPSTIAYAALSSAICQKSASSREALAKMPHSSGKRSAVIDFAASRVSCSRALCATP